MNIRSAPSHFQEFEAFLTSLETQFQIIALSETWFSDITIDTYGLMGIAMNITIEVKNADEVYLYLSRIILSTLEEHIYLYLIQILNHAL